MIEVRQTTRFSTWLAGLKDERARAKILQRLDRAGKGNLGDVASVGNGVSEMRIHYGPRISTLLHSDWVALGCASVWWRQVDSNFGHFRS